MLFVVIKRLPFEKEIKAEGIELRLDCFPYIDMQQLSAFLRSSPHPILCTVRKTSHGGSFKGSEEERLRLIRLLLALKPPLFDLEYDTDPSFFQEVREQFSHTKILCSYHNFEETPQDLEGLFAKMRTLPAFAYKIATRALSTLDALRMVRFVQEKTAEGERLSGICMGEEGSITRILGPAMGNFLDYASLEEGEESAPGQLTVEELLSLYHYKSLNTQTALYALIGDPVDKSVGHFAHNGWMKALHINAVYVKMAIKPEELSACFPLIKAIGMRGLSITMPLKESLLPYLDQIDPQAEKIGAINTLLFEKGRCRGYNTDGEAALEALEQKVKVKGKKIVLIGAGGAAKAIAFAAKQRGARLVILNRSSEKAEKLAEEVGERGGGLEEIAREWKEGYDILINTSAVLLPIDPQFILPQALVMDIHTLPKNTPFLLEAKKRGCKVVYGYEMFINQAVRQVEIWFKEKIPQSKVREMITSEIALHVI